jgi:polyphosphate kinase 2
MVLLPASSFERKFELGRLKRKHYEALLAPLQEELAQMGRWVQQEGKRLIILFEGRDAAGKGGAIDAIAGNLNPRQCRVVALPKPSEREAGQWYFQRYVAHLPARGEITLFDRSWYNRAGVERVMGYCTQAQADAFLDQVPVFEKQLVDDGALLFKYWLTCDQEQQEKRFAERAEDPLKRWKLSPVDLEARLRYADYTTARELMLKATHRAYAPWTLVEFNDQKIGRLTLVRDLLDRLPDTRLPQDVLSLVPLPGPPQSEHYATLQPIPSFVAPPDDAER